MQKTLKLGLPKGSLQESTVAMFKRAGFGISVSERSYVPSIDDPELEAILIRAQEMSRYVESGTVDAGITGLDWIRENDLEGKLQKVTELVYAKQGARPVRWVIAVPNNSPVKSVKDLAGRRIATELVGVTKAFLAAHKVKAEVEFSWGATEVKATAGLVDAIVEVTETGSSLRANNLRIVGEVVTSVPWLVANQAAWRDAWKRAKLEQLALLLRGALAAEQKVGLKMNVARSHLKRVVALLPAMREPTVSPLANSQWVAIETIVDEIIVRQLIPRLKAAGAEGIIEYPLNKVIP